MILEDPLQPQLFYDSLKSCFMCGIVRPTQSAAFTSVKGISGVKQNNRSSDHMITFTLLSVVVSCYGLNYPSVTELYLPRFSLVKMVLTAPDVKLCVEGLYQ